MNQREGGRGTGEEGDQSEFRAPQLPSSLFPLPASRLPPPAIRMGGIDKSFGAIRANRGASLEVLPGEIHALVGEYGAGKSTLMRILG
ncbi:MAG TPA: ATP-binding cassette domain-containing protein, partial [Gemmatimonadaceae bacterium]|nr:ATP-binding cassette domain-containing protein [Gemmatimonadaceae bacterium]